MISHSGHVRVVASGDQSLGSCEGVTSGDQEGAWLL